MCYSLDKLLSSRGYRCAPFYQHICLFWSGRCPEGYIKPWYIYGLFLFLACDCYSLGTSLGNSTLCDPVTGQCMCNATANIGGRRCDRCRENSWNNSAALCEGKPIHSQWKLCSIFLGFSQTTMVTFELQEKVVNSFSKVKANHNH